MMRARSHREGGSSPAVFLSPAASACRPASSLTEPAPAPPAARSCRTGLHPPVPPAREPAEQLPDGAVLLHQLCRAAAGAAQTREAALQACISCAHQPEGRIQASRRRFPPHCLSPVWQSRGKHAGACPHSPYRTPDMPGNGRAPGRAGSSVVLPVPALLAPAFLVPALLVPAVSASVLPNQRCCGCRSPAGSGHDIRPISGAFSAGVPVSSTAASFRGAPVPVLSVLPVPTLPVPTLPVPAVSASVLPNPGCCGCRSPVGSAQV